MTNTYANQIETGDSVYGSDGEKIGTIAGFADDYFVIEKGFLFTTDLYIPMSAVAGVDDDGVQLTMTKDEVENSDFASAPEGYESAGYESTDSSYASGGAQMSDQETLERTEERLSVDKQTQQTGSVSVGKHVVEERQAVDVPVNREEVTIERRSVDRPAEGSAFTEDSIEVPVYEETVEASKEARVVEELEIGKTVTSDTAHVEDTVRREEFDIDGDTGSSRNR
jgi:uncharacterized protein (TIGR02271 family)